MGFLRVATFVVFLTGKIYCSFPPENFRFNCMYDICTFPNQYCDLQDQRCHYCNDDVCRSDKVPEQCQYRCKGLQTTSPTTENSPKSEGQSSSSCPEWILSPNDVLGIILVVALVAIAALIIAVATIIYFVCCKNNRSVKTFTKRPNRSMFNVEAGIPLLQNNETKVAMVIGNEQEDGTKPQTPRENMEARSGHNNNILQGQSSKNGNASPTTKKVCHPDSSDSGSEGRHSNINDVDILNFGEPASSGAESESEPITVQNQHDNNKGRHNNVNDNNLLDPNLEKNDLFKVNNPITTPTDAGKVHKIQNSDILRENIDVDSGVNDLSRSNDSLTNLKQQVALVVT
ncbi:hypothetical protein KUTeg_003061 [Tegillarca granosa]|uniref:Uncharacterized protein n=1 Tax=Tegillarca granosa TaxID=220873 RepID=A0ABQ9FQH1_TEGGR|nr:hypothetical protein KUTeg_003061 [Tegillarca granosa]